MILPKQWPKCDRKTECRAVWLGIRTTAAFIASHGSSVDREGNVHPPAPRQTYNSFKCATCGRDWSEEA